MRRSYYWAMLTSCLLHPTKATAVVTCSCRYAVKQFNYSNAIVYVLTTLQRLSSAAVNFIKPKFIYTARTNYNYIKLYNMLLIQFLILWMSEIQYVCITYLWCCLLTYKIIHRVGYAVVCTLKCLWLPLEYCVHLWMTL